MHHLQGPSNDKGVIQMRGDISGNLPAAIFTSAWRQALNAIPTLRTSIHWKDLKKPVQIVEKQLLLEPVLQDWMGYTQEEVDLKWETLIENDRKQLLALNKAPVFRISYVKTAADRYRFLWTCHHILLDGWSSAMVLDAVFSFCKAQLTNDTFELTPTTPFMKFVSWEKSLPKIKQSRKWKTLLKNSYPQKQPLLSKANRQTHRTTVHDLTSISVSRLGESSRKNQVTIPSTLFASWAIILAKLAGQPNTVFGLTVAGRNNIFDDNSTMVGMFANTLPLPARVDHQTTLGELSKEIFQTQEEIQTLETCTAAEIHQWCELPPKQSLFDSLVVLGNYPETATSTNDPFTVENVNGQLSSQTPLTLAFEIKEVIQISIIVDESIPESWTSSLVDSLEYVLSHYITSPATLIGELEIPLLDFPDHIAQTHDASPKNLGHSKVIEKVEDDLIKNIWSDILEIEEIGPSDNFFELGGNSLLAAHLIERLQVVFQKPVPLNILFEAPTIELMAKQLITNSAEDWPLLIPLQKGGNRPPLFLFHEMGVSIFHYQHLIKHLPDDLPIYGVQAPYEPQESVRSMTELYLKEIRKTYPEGPLYLGGYCFGGILAYDMALMLEQQGTPAKGLYVIELTFTELVRFRLRYLWAIFKEETIWQHTIRLFNKAKKITYRIVRAIAPGEKGFKDEARDYYDTSLLPETTRHRTEVHFRAARDYKPQKYGGEIVVILCDTVYSQRDPQAGWDRLINDEKNLHIYHNKSDHHSILEEPHVREVSESILNHLD